MLNTSTGVINDDPPTLRNDQIDKILEAVAEWEIPWDALQIAERIGIGKYQFDFMFRFLCTYPLTYDYIRVHISFSIKSSSSSHISDK